MLKKNVHPVLALCDSLLDDAHSSPVKTNY